MLSWEQLDNIECALNGIENIDVYIHVLELLTKTLQNEDEKEMFVTILNDLRNRALNISERLDNFFSEEYTKFKQEQEKNKIKEV